MIKYGDSKWTRVLQINNAPFDPDCKMLQTSVIQNHVEIRIWLELNNVIRKISELDRQAL